MRASLRFVIASLALIATFIARRSVAFSPSFQHLHRSSVLPSSVLLQETSSPEDSDGPVFYVRCGKCQSAYSIKESDLGTGPRSRGRRMECTLCGHSWFQSKDRLMRLQDGFEMVELPESDKERIKQNIEEGKAPKFLGESKLYIGNISFDCHEDDIHTIFSEVGDVGDVSLVRDETGKIRGFGFVTMRTKEDGQRAIDELDGTAVRGRNIAVRESSN